MIPAVPRLKYIRINTTFMILGSAQSDDQFFVDVVREWFSDIAHGRWAEAYNRLDRPPEFGPPITAQSFRQEIENDHYADGTVFRNAHPGPIVYSDPASIGQSRYTDVFRADDGTVEVLHPIPIHNEWTDLIATFQFLPVEDGYYFRLDSFYVHRPTYAGRGTIGRNGAAVVAVFEIAGSLAAAR